MNRKILSMLALLIACGLPLFAVAQAPRLLVPNTMPGLSYPAKALAAGESGTVLARLKISEFGQVMKVLDVQAVKGSAEFEGAVRANLERWSFRRAIRGKCEQEETEGVAQIDFTVSNGRGRIAAAGRPDVEARMAAFNPKPADLSLQAFVNAGYPPRAANSRLAAAVAVAVDYEITTGIPVAARTAQVSLASAPAYPEAAQEFAEAATAAMMRTRFQREGGEPGELTQACVVLQYVPRGAGEISKE